MDLWLFVAKCRLVPMFVHGSELLVENPCSDSLFVHHNGRSVEKLLGSVIKQASDKMLEGVLSDACCLYGLVWGYHIFFLLTVATNSLR